MFNFGGFMNVSKFLFTLLFTMTALSAPLVSMGAQPNIGVISSSEETIRQEWAFSEFADEILTFLNPHILFEGREANNLAACYGSF